MDRRHLIALGAVFNLLSFGALANCMSQSPSRDATVDGGDAGEAGDAGGMADGGSADRTVDGGDADGTVDGPAADAPVRAGRCICPTGFSPDDVGTCSDGDGGAAQCANPVLVGAYATNLHGLEREIGHTLSMNLTHEGFVFGDGGLIDRGTPFPGVSEFADDLDAGRIPILSMECLCRSSTLGVDGGDPGLIKGRKNSAAGKAAEALATQLAEYPGQILFRYCWEMNGTPSPTFCEPDTDGSTSNADVPAPDFVSEWKILYEIMHPIAPNLAWYWCPLNEKDCTNSTRWYPRAVESDPYCSYVDFAGWDDFDLDASGFATTATTPYLAYTAPDAGIDQPFIIGATGELANPPTLQPEFMNGDATPGILAGQFPRIVGINYFDVGLSRMGRSFGLTEAGTVAFGQFVSAEGQCPTCQYPPGLYTRAPTCTPGGDP